VTFRDSAETVKKAAHERGYVAPVLLDASGDVTGKLYGVWGPLPRPSSTARDN